MGRHPFLRNNLLWISIVILLIGIALTVVAYSAPGADWTDPYESMLPSAGGGDWNMLIRVVAPVILITGAWYVGEQIIARRRFNRLINAEKKSEFQQNLPTLEETVRDLPDKYEDRLEQKQTDFKSRR